MILFEDIFNRAVNLFDDPDILRAYELNPVEFSKTMRPYLINGLGMFANPTTVSSRFSDYTEAQGRLEVFDGNGGASYTLSTTPLDNAVMSFFIGKTPDPLAEYNPETKVVTFSRDVPNGTPCSAEWYYAGEFAADFTGFSSNISSAFIEARTKDILAHCLLLGWAENEKNFMLDIRNILTDTDFKLHSPANSVRAKTEWYQNIREGLNDLTQKLSWDLWSGAIGGKQIGK